MSSLSPYMYRECFCAYTKSARITSNSSLHANELAMPTEITTTPDIWHGTEQYKGTVTTEQSIRVSMVD